VIFSEDGNICRLHVFKKVDKPKKGSLNLAVNYVKMKTVLITGGSGMVGKELTKLLTGNNYRVIWLSRERHVKAEIPRYRWDYRRGEIDLEAVKQADVIVHLAGSNLGDDAWTRMKKQRIVESRVQTARLLLETVKKLDKQLDVFVSASAVGYYGMATVDRVFTEADVPAKGDFLSRTCKKWENAAFTFQEERGIRTVALRTAFVIAKESDGFKKMLLPTRIGLGAPLGSGRQAMNWVHIDDLCRMYLKAIEDRSMRGVYNAAAPHQTTNKEFMQALARGMKRPFFFPKVPSFLLRLFMGEAAGMILEGSPVSSEKIQNAGFSFDYPNADGAIAATLEAIKETAS